MPMNIIIFVASRTLLFRVQAFPHSLIIFYKLFYLLINKIRFYGLKAIC
jgi:hypothetical protein